MTLGIVLAVLVAAVPEWTLEGCIERGLQEGVSLQRQELLLRQRRSDERLALLDGLPEISLRTGCDFGWGRTVDMQELMIVDHRLNFSNSWSVGASLSSSRVVSTLLEQREKRYLREEAAAGREAMETGLKIAITEAYLELLLADKNYENACTGYESILAQRERTEKEVLSGRLSYRSLAEIEARSATEKAAVASARGNRRTAAMNLSRYLNLPPEEELTVAPPAEDSLPEPWPMPSAGDIARYVATHPRIRQAEASLGTGQVALRKERASLLPDLTVAGGYGTYYSNASRVTWYNQLTGNGNPSLGVTLTIPLPGGQSFTRLRQRSSAVSQQACEIEELRQELESEMLSSLLNAINCYESCLAAEENMKALGTAFRANEARFENGAISSSEYLISRTNWQKAVGAYWQARYRYLFQLKIISLRKIPVQEGGAQ
ncbi:MAG: TolC family protein [Bacteroidales bacterium]|nr:TolC family protein [Bacteroidales bacterium]